MRLTIYSKPGCHLCDEMKSVIHRILDRQPGYQGVSVEEIDISTDAGLSQRYGLEIPVLLIDGTKVAKYRLTEEELVRMIDSRA